MTEKVEQTFPGLRRPGYKGIVREFYRSSGPNLLDETGPRVLFRMVQYEPGNGSRYDVQLSYAPYGARYVVNVVNLRTSMEVAARLHPETCIGYMLEKLGHTSISDVPIITQGDCYALIPLINDFIDECQER